jgi:hydroxypyruvate reductase
MGEPESGQTDAPPAQRRLRDDAWKIWLAGLEAVRADKLVGRAVRREGAGLWIGDELLELNEVGRIVVVGAGKAGAGMAAGLEAALGSEWLRDKQVAGLVNVPADCLRPLERIELHAARPAGVNEPRPEGVRGTERMLDMIAALNADDVCIALISGGGSALLPAPEPGISLADKIAVARVLSAAGANIAQLNAVRRQLSRVKGGGLARACRAGWLFTLIISDVLGDPLEVIASGPTVENPSTPADALAVLHELRVETEPSLRGVVKFLQDRAVVAPDRDQRTAAASHCRVVNLVIGNNATAVDAAGMEAERLGYWHAMHAATSLEGEAEEVGRHLADMALHMAGGRGPNCLITGGEPVVRLADAAVRGIGGRNQQLALAALQRLCDSGAESGSVRNTVGDGVAMLSAGTDGEDGPTDAAGAVVDGDVWRRAAERNLDPADFLRRNDAYRFFEQSGGLLRTGPTHTNVCDVRVVLTRRTTES